MKGGERRDEEIYHGRWRDTGGMQLESRMIEFLFLGKYCRNLTGAGKK